MACKATEPTTTELTKEPPCEYKIDSEAGSMLLIDMLYEKGKINKTTYNNIQKKYGVIATLFYPKTTGLACP